MERIVIPARLQEAMLDHARTWQPKECCGLLGGRRKPEGIQAERFFACANVLASPVHYAIDPRDILSVMRTLDEEGLELVAIYHSHPATMAYPSASDVAEAHYPDAVYLIASLAAPHDPVLRGFHIQGQAISEVAVITAEKEEA